MDLFGYTDKDQMRREFNAAERYRDPGRRAELLKALHERGELTGCEMEMTRRDGTPMWCRGTLRIHAGQGFIEGVVVDTTEQRQAEMERDDLRDYVEQARLAEYLGKMAGGLAHRLNNLLQVILGNAEMMELSLPEGADAGGQVRRILDATRHATMLGKQMLAYSGASKLVLRTVDIGAVAVEVTTHMSRLAPPGVEVEMHDCGGLRPFAGDAEQLREAVLQLVQNGVESLGPRGGTVSVKCGLKDCDRQYLDQGYLGRSLQPGEFLSISVRDTGCGVAPSILPRIFDPFFSTHGPGRGLGLGTVFGIARGHGGGVRVETEEGIGSVFELLLPLSRGGQESTPAESESPGGNGSHSRLILVEPETVVREVTREVLEIWGHSVSAFVSATDAATFLGGHVGEYGAAIVNVLHADGAGIGIVRSLRDLDPDLPIVITSSFDGGELRALMENPEHIEFLQKPYQMDELRQHLDRMLRRPGDDGRRSPGISRAPASSAR